MQVRAKAGPSASPLPATYSYAGSVLSWVIPGQAPRAGTAQRLCGPASTPGAWSQMLPAPRCRVRLQAVTQQHPTACCLLAGWDSI